MQIIPTACDCNKKSKTCRRIVIEKRKSKGSDTPFQVRRMTQTLSQWNLSVFAHPRHPHFDNRKIVHSFDCKFLNLDFDTVVEREEFALKFNRALELRDAAEKEFRRICNRTSFLSEKLGEIKPKEKERRASTPSRVTRASTGSSFKGSIGSSSSSGSGDTMRAYSIPRKPVSRVELPANSLMRLRPISTFSSLNMSGMMEKDYE
jgi:hypothetical protein